MVGIVFGNLVRLIDPFSVCPFHIYTDREGDCVYIHIHMNVYIHIFICVHTYIFKSICVDEQSCQSQQCLVRMRYMVEEVFLPS